MSKEFFMLNAGINTLINGVLGFGFAFSGLYVGGSWMSRFLDAAALSEFGFGLSVFLRHKIYQILMIIGAN